MKTRYLLLVVCICDDPSLYTVSMQQRKIVAFIICSAESAQQASNSCHIDMLNSHWHILRCCTHTTNQVVQILVYFNAV